MPKKEVSKQGRNGGGAIPSPKLGTMVYYRNSIKRDYIRLLDYDSDAQMYEEWPCTITYCLGELEYTYTPDFAVYRRQGKPSIVVCTRQANVNDPQYIPRWTATHLWCEQHNHTFKIITEVLLQQCGALLSNVQLQAVNAHHPPPPQAYDYLIKVVASSDDPVAIADIVDRAPRLSARAMRAYLWHLLEVGVLSTDLTEPLHVAHTLIKWKGVPHAIPSAPQVHSV